MSVISCKIKLDYKYRPWFGLFVSSLYTTMYVTSMKPRNTDNKGGFNKNELSVIQWIIIGTAMTIYHW